MDEQPVLLLVDGHSLAYRAFYALPVESFRNSAGSHTNAVFGFTSMLINVLKAEKPSHVAVVFDASETTFRNDIYPEYKAQREASPVEFGPQIPLIEDVCQALGLQHVQKVGFEADDIIATLAKEANRSQMHTLILTGDRDSFQLINDDTTVLYARRGVSDLARMTPSALMERLGITPAQYPEYAALRGDPSDNLPSVPGVGEKTAAKWIIEYGDVEALIANADKIKGKVGESLRNHVAVVTRNLELTRLVTDVPLEITLGDCRRQPIEPTAINQLFDLLEFTSLRPKALSLGQSESKPRADRGQASTDADGDFLTAKSAVGNSNDGWVLLPNRSKQLRQWLDGLASTPIGVAFRGAWGAGSGAIYAIALAGPNSEGFVIDFENDQDEVRQIVLAWLETDFPKCIHDANGPALALKSMGRTLRGLYLDTALAAYLVLPGQRTFEISSLAQRLCGFDLTPSESPSGQLALEQSIGSDPITLLKEAGAIREVADKLAVTLHERDSWSLLADIEQPLIGVLVDMEHVGIATDRSGLATIEASLAAETESLQQQAFQLVGREFNLGSPKQLQVVLFEERGLPKTRKTKTGWTTDADALTALFATNPDPLLEVIIAWRERSKLRQTVASLIPLISSDGRIHTTFNQMVAATGRLSSSDPNLQNIPARSADGQKIRECFTVGDDFECLMTADYDQIELRVMAHVSNDAGLQAAFASGEDLHNTVGAQIFDVPPNEIDSDLRRRVKAISYGLAYGLSPYGLSQQLGISTDEAKALTDTYFERFSGVRDYLQAVVSQAAERGYTETILGRRRYLPDLKSENRQRREMAERMALNAPIQGSAADIMKVAMLKVARGLREAGLRSRLLLAVHDELVLEVAPGEEEATRELVVGAMRNACEISVPLAVSVGVGKTWASAAH